jgi:hypothetical protein
MYMRIKRNHVLILLVVLGAAYAWNKYESYEDKEKSTKEAAEKKDMSQAELNAVLKFIR